jgi:hypothetical protein
VSHRPASVIAAALATVALAAGCGGGGGGDEKAGGRRAAETGSPSGAAADYARAERAMRANDYDTAIKRLTELGGYRDARKRLAAYRLVAAREKLAAAMRKLRQAPSPQAAVALAKTSLRYHPTPEARRFLRRAEAAHARFKRRQKLGLEGR